MDEVSGTHSQSGDDAVSADGHLTRARLSIPQRPRIDPRPNVEVVPNEPVLEQEAMDFCVDAAIQSTLPVKEQRFTLEQLNAYKGALRESGVEPE